MLPCKTFSSAARTRLGPVQIDMISLAVLAFVVSMVTTLLVRRWFRHWRVFYPHDAPQRFHQGHVPRVGGIGLLVGWVAALAALPVLQ